MISDVDDRLVAWARGVAPNAEVALELRSSSPDALTVGLYLYAIAHEPTARSWERPPHQLWARYLVTTSGPSARDEHEALGDLLVAALDDVDLVVETQPWTAVEWQAAGIPPRPCFAVSTLVRIERPLDPAPAVLRDLDLRAVGTTDFEGVVVGPGETPLVDVRVELVGAGGKATRTDARGHFRFRAVPESSERELVLTTKNRRLSVTAHRQDGALTIIRLEPPGG